MDMALSELGVKYEDEEKRWQIELADTVRLELLGTVLCRSGWVGLNHSHSFWELVYIKKECSDPYEMFCGGRHLTCEQSALFLIPPDTPHIFRNYGRETAENMYIGFSYHFQPEKKLCGEMPVMVRLDNPYAVSIVTMLNEISELSKDETLAALDKKRIDFTRAVISVFRLVLDEADQYENSNSARAILLCNKVKEYIMQNMDRHISVDELARQFYISANYLGQTFRQNTGMTVKTYHNRMRMEFALRLISEDEYSISKVAELVGFDDIAYFSKKFKEFYGVAPSQIVNRESE